MSVVLATMRWVSFQVPHFGFPRICPCTIIEPVIRCIYRPLPRAVSHRRSNCLAGKMLKRLLTISLIVTFLPLPGMESVEAMELAVGIWGGTETASTDLRPIRFDDPCPSRVVHHTWIYPSENMAFCEAEDAEKELRENETESDEENDFGLVLYFEGGAGGRIIGGTLWNLVVEGVPRSHSFRSRHRILRC